jgi:septal ring factor EnvC (AmiA/AmiB activator)
MSKTLIFPFSHFKQPFCCSLLLFICLLIASCNHSEVDRLNKKVSQLKDKLKEKNETLSKLKAENERLTKRIKEMAKKIEKQNKVKDYSNKEIISFVKQKVRFDNPDIKRKNFAVRKLNNKTYKVRYKIPPVAGFGGDWRTVIYKVTIISGGKYKLRQVDGPINN